MADYASSFKTDEDKQKAIASAQRQLKEKELRKRQLNLTAPIVVGSGKTAKTIRPNELTFEQKKALGNESRAINKELVELRSGVDALSQAPVAGEQPNQAAVVAQLSGFGLDEAEAADLYNRAAQGDLNAVIEKMPAIGSAAAGLGSSGIKLAMGLGESLFNMAERAAEQKGDTRGPLSRMAVGPDAGFQMPLSEAEAKQDMGSGALGGLSPRVVESAKGGTRSFTNIGTPGGQIQEIGADSGLIEVVRKSDGSRGWLPKERFDAAKFEPVTPATDFVGPAQPEPPVQTAVAPPPAANPPLPPAAIEGPMIPRQELFARSAPVQLPDFSGMANLFQGTQPQRRAGATLNPLARPLTPFGF